jgi:hypothetical protein
MSNERGIDRSPGVVLSFQGGADIFPTAALLKKMEISVASLKFF